MRKLIKKSQLKDDARLLSNKIVESIETCAGVIGFLLVHPLKGFLVHLSLIYLMVD